MNINPISFKGTFRLNQEDLDNKRMKKILSQQDELFLSFETSDYRNPDKLFIQTFDEMDTALIKLLNKLKLPFVRIDEADSLDPENIKNRIVINENINSKNSQLVEVNVADLDRELKKHHDAYVGKHACTGSSYRYDRFIKYLKTNQNIKSTIIYLNRGINGEISTHVYDGNHRFAVMRDLGLKTIPITIDEESLELAREIGLVKN